MKEHHKAVIILISICAFAGILTYKLDQYFNPEIKPGQVWYYHGGISENPFSNNKIVPIETNKVLDVKGEYVKYVDLQTNDTSSCTKRWFKIGSELKIIF